MPWWFYPILALFGMLGSVWWREGLYKAQVVTVQIIVFALLVFYRNEIVEFFKWLRFDYRYAILVVIVACFWFFIRIGTAFFGASNLEVSKSKSSAGSTTTAPSVSPPPPGQDDAGDAD